MTQPSPIQFDPKLDLVLERTVDVPPHLVWLAWTRREHLMKWFTPAPWQTVDCEIDLRPGGLFRTVMRSPDGKDYPNVGCYLEVIENHRLTWTSVLGPGFRPLSTTPGGGKECDFPMTATVMLEPHGAGTKYTAIAIHAGEEGRKKHEEMGFKEGWGICLDQLVAYAKQL